QVVVDNILNTLTICLDELDDVFQPILDTVLIHLLPVTKTENPKSNMIAQALLRNTFSRVLQPISQFINNILTGIGPSGGASESDLAEHVLPLVYELHKVKPGMLLYVLPNVATQLQAEDLEVRSRAITALGRLFASQYADYGVEFPRNWRDFLGRFKDVEPQIRSSMVMIGVTILGRKPALRSDLLEALGLRLLDPEWEVRRVAVQALVDLAMSNLDAMPVEFVIAIGERIKDKKHPIRKDAVTGLSQVFAKHISKRWVDTVSQSEESEVEEKRDDNEVSSKGRGGGSKKGKGKDTSVVIPPVPQDLEEKLCWIPGAVVKACALAGDLDLRKRVLQVLDDHIIPRDMSDEGRAAGLAILRHRMDTHARQGLQWILQDKRHIRGDVLRYLDARDKQRQSPKDKDLQKAVDVCLTVILTRAPTPDKKLSLLHRLNDHPDKKVFRLLREVCSVEGNPALTASCRGELVKKLGSKTLLGEYVRTLARRCCVLAVGSQGLRSLISTFQKGIEDHDEGAYLPPLELLETWAIVFPEQIMGQLGPLVAAFQSAQEEGMDKEVLRILKVMAAARMGGDLHRTRVQESEEDEEEHETRTEEEIQGLDSFLKALVQLSSREGTPGQAEEAVHALAALTYRGSQSESQKQGYRHPTGSVAGPGKATVVAAQSAAKVAIRHLVSSRSLSVGNPRLPVSLRALAAFAADFPREFQPHEAKARAFASALVAEGTAWGGEGGDEGAGIGPPPKGENGETKVGESDDEEAPGGQGGSKGRGGVAKKGGGDGKRGKGNQGSSSSLACQTMCASLDLLCNCLLARAMAGKGAGGKGRPEEGEEDLLQAAFWLLKKGGQMAGSEGVVGVAARMERAMLRLAAARCVTRLCMHHTKGKAVLSPKRWHALAWTLLDPVESVRTDFMKEICRGLVTCSGFGGGTRGGGTASGPSTLRFMAFLCLVATETEALRNEARAAVKAAIWRLRQVHEQAATRVAAAAPMANEASRGEEKLAIGAGTDAVALISSMPEYVLPYMVHLLAHHPDFPVDKDDKPRLKNLERCLVFILGPLLGSAKEGAMASYDNLPLLLQMLDTIVCSYEDAVEPGSERIQTTALLAHQVLRGQIRTQNNLQTYRGTIFLPTSLYKPQNGDLKGNRYSQGGLGITPFSPTPSIPVSLASPSQRSPTTNTPLHANSSNSKVMKRGKSKAAVSPPVTSSASPSATSSMSTPQPPQSLDFFNPSASSPIGLPPPQHNSLFSGRAEPHSGSRSRVSPQGAKTGDDSTSGTRPRSAGVGVSPGTSVGWGSPILSVEEGSKNGDNLEEMRSPISSSPLPPTQASSPTSSMASEEGGKAARGPARSAREERLLQRLSKERGVLEDAPMVPSPSGKKNGRAAEAPVLTRKGRKRSVADMDSEGTKRGGITSAADSDERDNNKEASQPEEIDQPSASDKGRGQGQDYSQVKGKDRRRGRLKEGGEEGREEAEGKTAVSSPTKKARRGGRFSASVSTTTQQNSGPDSPSNSDLKVEKGGDDTDNPGKIDPPGAAGPSATTGRTKGKKTPLHGVEQEVEALVTKAGDSQTILTTSASASPAVKVRASRGRG
ncbi:unnamed protein product, partial [Choristocarpus tenellus]